MRLYGEAFIRLIYPACCGVCRTVLELEEQGICCRCSNELTALRFSWNEAILSHDLSWLDEGWTLYPYESPVKEILTAIKFMKKRWLMRAFKKDIEFLASALSSENHYDALIPIPLDGRRLLEREFNQSELIARFIAKTAGIPVEKKILIKRWSALSQSQLSAEERRANLNGVFKIKRTEKVSGKSFLLVDDIFTTGTTAQEAAKTLKKHGAERVDIFAIARTELK